MDAEYLEINKIAVLPKASLLQSIIKTLALGNPLVLKSGLIILCKKEAKKDLNRHNSETKKKKKPTSKETKGVATFLGASVRKRLIQYQLPKAPHKRRKTTRKGVAKTPKKIEEFKINSSLVCPDTLVTIF